MASNPSMPPPRNPGSLNVIALISGGKDSFFTILHCLSQGHKVIALANLHPPYDGQSGGQSYGPQSAHIAPESTSLQRRRSVSGDSISPSSSNGRLGQDQGKGADSEQDLNSYLYQTAGHGVIPLYEKALFGMPLYRAPIKGYATNKEKDYSVMPWQSSHAEQLSQSLLQLGLLPSSSSASASTTASSPKSRASLAEELSGQLPDETEDLIPLLKKIIADHPAANALCSGAILSNYQRTRIESVCRRLNLVPLAFLWQYPNLPCPIPFPRSLLVDMAAVGLEARIIKVASGGLNESFLWENLADEGVQRRLENALYMFGGSVLGEGGEYETLVVRGPRWGGWQASLDIEKHEMLLVEKGGGEAFLSFNAAGYKLKPMTADKDKSTMNDLRKPEVFDEAFERLLQVKDPHWLADLPLPEPKLPEPSGGEWLCEKVTTSEGNTVKISNISSLGSPGCHTLEQQIEAVCTEIVGSLRAEGLSPENVVFATILLRSMSHFEKFNAVYGTLFTKPNPPARVTVACGNLMPHGRDFVVSVVAYRGQEKNREGLHVQSRSYWAPANIGPYSQAISIVPLTQSLRACETPPTPAEYYKASFRPLSQLLKAVIFVAGQISLVPATMIPMPDDDPEDLALAAARNFSAEEYRHRVFVGQALLAAQHLWRIGIEMSVDWWTGAVAYVAGDNCAQKAKIAGGLWTELHTEEMWAPDQYDEVDDGDGPDLWDRTHGGMGTWAGPPQRKVIPNFAKLAAAPGGLTDGNQVVIPKPSFLAVEVSELPRGVPIEWQSVGIAGDNIGLRPCKVSAQCGTHGQSTAKVCFHQFPRAERFECVEECLKNFVCWQHHPLNQTGGAIREEHPRRRKATGHAMLFTPHPERFDAALAQIIPCKRVWGFGKDGVFRELWAGLILWHDF